MKCAGINLPDFLFLRKRWGTKRPNGLLTAVFLTGYGLARFVVEFFREPDPGYELLLGWMSKGQALSLGMLFVALKRKFERTPRNLMMNILQGLTAS